MMYPGITASANGHGFQYRCAESLPLADRPHILKATSEKEELFGLPTAHRTFDEHQVSKLFDTGSVKALLNFVTRIRLYHS